MVNPLISWIISHVKDGDTNEQIKLLYGGPISEKNLTNRINEVRVFLDALNDLEPPEKDTSTIESTHKDDNTLEIALKTYSIQNEEDLRKWLGYEDKERYRCVRFMCRPSQNETRPWFIVQGTFEERQFFPALEKVSIPFESIRQAKVKQTQAVLNLGDLHIPFHDERCMVIAVQIARDLQPTHIVLNGDGLDATDLSKWPADIEHRNRIQGSLVIMAQFIAQLREACPGAKIVYMEGNHEARLQKEILKSVAGAVGLKRIDDLDGYDAISIPNLLCLKERDIEWFPYREKGFWLHDRLKFHHGEELNVAKMVKDRKYSMVIGHGHRVEIASKANEEIDGQRENYVCMFGCMCKLDGSVPSVKSSMNWQQSIGVVYYDGDRSNPVPVYIHEGMALFNGKKYNS